MSWVAGKAQVEISADDSKFQAAGERTKRILGTMGKDMQITSHGIRSALSAAGGHFQHFAMSAADGAADVGSLSAGVLSLGSIVKYLIVPVSLGVFWLKLLGASAEASKRQMKELEQETKSLADVQTAFREKFRGRAPMELGMGASEITAAIGERKAALEAGKKEIEALRESIEREYGKATKGGKKAGGREPAIVPLPWGITPAMLEARKKQGAAAETPSQAVNLEKQVTQELAKQEVLTKEITALEKMQKELGLADLLKKKIGLQEETASLGLRQLTTRRPPTAQFMGGVELWKSMQIKLATGGQDYAKRTAGATEKTADKQALIVTELKLIDEKIGRLKGVATFQ